MSRNPEDGGLDALLSNADWLRGLARCLVHSRADADDLLQETWAAALRSPPDPGRPPRPWLAQVLRNLIRMDARAAGRRRAREEVVGGLAEGTASTDAVLERLELQRLVVGMVKELEEPLRTTMLLRFFEGRQPAEIAQAQGVPAGTVRWRLSEGLRRLRQRLDEAHGGRREDWRLVLLPLAAPIGGERTAPGPSRLALYGAGAALTGIVGAVLWLNGAETPAPARQTGTSGTPLSSERQPTQEEKTMLRNFSTMAALFGVGLPALVAAADDAKTLTPAETIDFCIEMREKMVACREVLADIRISRVPAEKREGSRKMVLKEIVEDGTGPLEARRSKCATELKMPKAAWISYLTKADVATIRDCQVEKDCKMGVACWMNAVEPVVARSRKR